MLKPADPGPIEKVEEPEISDLLGRLVDDAEAYARAELKVAKAIVEAKIDAFKLPSALLAAALFFAQSALTVLAVAIALALSPFVGPVAAGLVAFLIFGGIAAALVWIGLNKLRQEL